MRLNGREDEAQDVGGVSPRREYIFLATLFTIQISGLVDRFLLEIQGKVNLGREKPQFSKIPFENRNKLRSQIVVCHSRNDNSAYDSTEKLRTQYNVSVGQQTRC
jgi:hypothetical protein